MSEQDELAILFFTLLDTCNLQWRSQLPLKCLKEISPLKLHKSPLTHPPNVQDAQSLASSIPKLWSSNEVADDLPTTSLKYVLVSFILGQALESGEFNLEARPGNLLTAKLQYQLFAYDVLSLYRETSLGKKAQKLWDKATDSRQREMTEYESAALRRAQVLERQEMMDELDREIEKHAAEGLKEEDSTEGRFFWQLLSMRFLIDAAKSLEMISKELEILAARKQASETAKENLASENDHQLRLDGYGEVLKKPFIIKIANSAELRKLYASEVFRPGHILPTVTLAEVAAAEMAMEVDGLGAAQKKEAPELTEEESEMKARTWDDWKDANPRGSGNKMVNRG